METMVGIPGSRFHVFCSYLSRLLANDVDSTWLTIGLVQSMPVVSQVWCLNGFSLISFPSICRKNCTRNERVYTTKGYRTYLLNGIINCHGEGDVSEEGGEVFRHCGCNSRTQNVGADDGTQRCRSHHQRAPGEDFDDESLRCRHLALQKVFIQKMESPSLQLW